MKIDIKHIESDIIISGKLYYDKCGNIIIVLPFGNYFLSINEVNDIEFFKIVHIDRLDDLIDEIHIEKLINKTDKILLKNKIINTLEHEKEDLSDSDVDSDIDDHEYYPEDKFFYIDNKDDKDIDDNSGFDKEYGDIDDDDKFIFASTSENIITCYNKFIDCNAIYDFLIMDNSINKSYFISEIKHQNPYRITLNLENTWILNIIGTCIVSYKLFFNDDNLIFVKVTT